ncbi:hypothetical protein [Streptomyces xylophagus]|uniref:hypothetical protein n=1 Tax=Streptomyces xylophagus TaxID=285514 RepID=UPI00068CEF27|nr:hypothetical protein [Streptomyces xylophagus]
MPSTTPPETTAEKPYDPFAFPDDLTAAQKELHETYAALHRFQKELAWSSAPHAGFNDTDRWRNAARPATERWTPDQKTEYERLWSKLRELTACIAGHKHWENCPQEKAVEARQALKHAPGATPDPAPAGALEPV